MDNDGEVGAANGQTDERRPARRRPVLGIVCGVVLVVLFAGLAFVATRSEPEIKFCAGVGTIGAPERDSREEAFEAWLATVPTAPPRESWKRDGNDYVNTEAEDRQEQFTDSQSRLHYRSVHVTKGEDLPGLEGLDPDGWIVSGACV